MSDMGISYNEDSLRILLREARSLLNLLDAFQTQQDFVGEVPISTLERASLTFHQLTLLLDLAVQEQSRVARPQEEADVQRSAAQDVAPVDGVSSGAETPVAAQPPGDEGSPLPGS